MALSSTSVHPTGSGRRRLISSFSQAEGENSNFLCLFVLFGPLMSSVMPTPLGEAHLFLPSPLIQMLIASETPLMDGQGQNVYAATWASCGLIKLTREIDHHTSLGFLLPQSNPQYTRPWSCDPQALPDNLTGFLWPRAEVSSLSMSRRVEKY